jgi:AraC-like DNA-binding protein
MASTSAAPRHPAASLRRYAGEYVAHEHEHAQVLVGLKGRLELELNGRSTYVDASCALIVPAGIAHGYLADAPAQVLVIDSPVFRGLERVRRFVPPKHWKDPQRVFDPQAALGEVIDTPTVLLRRHIDLPGLDAAIDGDLHGAWTTARLAALCQLSPQRFHARFLELTGVAPAAYVRQRRLDRAQHLLRAGIPLETTALQTGYASASALAYALKRERGIGARLIRSRR